MSKNTLALKNSIDAHGWLGLIFSFALFLIFWAGAVSLFKVEIQHWAESPNHPIDQYAENKKLSELIDQKLTEYPVDPDSRLTIKMPGEQRNYYLMRLTLLNEDKDSDKKTLKAITVDPKTGDTIGKAGQYSFSSFMFELHHNLHWPGVGIYITGLVSLFLLVALLSGIYIHSKKIISNFFVYRTNNKRTQLRDFHNLVGVISLPYTLMYAITGTVFNLILIFQITFVVFLYQGDANGLLNDVGLPKTETIEPTGIPYDMENLTNLLHSVENEYGPVNTLRITHYGDLSAVVQFQGDYTDRFAKRYTVDYAVYSQEKMGESGVAHNAFQNGFETLNTLHYGSFAGLDIRIIYFVLALSILAMIIAGNLLWVEKRRTQLAYSRSVNITAQLTLGSCFGLLLATSVGFLLERILPGEWISRNEMVESGFLLTLTAIILVAFFIKNNIRFMAFTFYAISVVLISVIIMDWVLYSESIVSLTKNGQLSVVGVEIALVLFSVVSVVIGRIFHQKISTETSEHNATYMTPTKN